MDFMLCMTAVELIILLLIGEERFQALYLKAHFYAFIQLLIEIGNGDQMRGLALLFLRGVHGRADGGKQVRMLRSDHVLRSQLQSPDKSVFKLRQEMKRTAQESYVAPDRLAAGQAADGLIDHSLEDGGRQILLGCPVVDQRLYIGFCKDTAAGGDGVDGLIMGRVLVKAGRVGLQKSGHLVDEGAGAAGADTVHSLLDAAGEVDDLGVLAAQLDGYVGLRRIVLQRGGHGDYLLNEGNLQKTGQ